MLGGLLGVLLAKASMQLILAFAPVDLPRRSEISVNGVSLAFSCGLVLLTGLGFGLVPALQATRVDLNQVLKDSGRGSGEGRGGLRLRRLLVIAEVALAVVLLVGAGLLSKSFLGMVNTPARLRAQGPVRDAPRADAAGLLDSGRADHLLRASAGAVGAGARRDLGRNPVAVGPRGKKR